MIGHFKSETARKNALSYAYAREQESAQARQIVEELKRNIDQGCNVGAALESAPLSRSAHYYPDEYYR